MLKFQSTTLKIKNTKSIPCHLYFYLLFKRHKKELIMENIETFIIKAPSGRSFTAPKVSSKHIQHKINMYIKKISYCLFLSIQFVLLSVLFGYAAYLLYNNEHSTYPLTQVTGIKLYK